MTRAVTPNMRCRGVNLFHILRKRRLSRSALFMASSRQARDRLGTKGELRSVDMDDRGGRHGLSRPARGLSSSESGKARSGEGMI